MARLTGKNTYLHEYRFHPFSLSLPTCVCLYVYIYFFITEGMACLMGKKHIYICISICFSLFFSLYMYIHIHIYIYVYGRGYARMSYRWTPKYTFAKHIFAKYLFAWSQPNFPNTQLCTFFSKFRSELTFQNFLRSYGG